MRYAVYCDAEGEHGDNMMTEIRTAMGKVTRLMYSVSKDKTVRGVQNSPIHFSQQLGLLLTNEDLVL